MTHEERMEITYQKYPHLRPDSWKSKSERKISEILQSMQDDLPPDPDIHGDICPHCGQKTLLHEEGCVKCTSCAWSACG